NLVYAITTGTILSFNGKNWGCSSLVPSADVDGDGTAGDGVSCLDPRFISLSVNDLHLGPTSPAIDAGTSTGMPTGRSSSISNAVAGIHGLPSYADNSALKGSAWDIGATEFGASVSVTASLSLSDPSPTAAGTVTVTLVTS